MRKTALVFLLILSACGGSNNQTSAASDPTTTPTPPVTPPATTLVATYDSINANIFQPQCYSCHTGATPAGGDDLSNYQSLISGGDVVSGNPEQSALYLEVKNGNMPKNGTPLTAQEVQVIYDWIQAGLPKS